MIDQLFPWLTGLSLDYELYRPVQVKMSASGTCRTWFLLTVDPVVVHILHHEPLRHAVQWVLRALFYTWAWDMHILLVRKPIRWGWLANLLYNLLILSLLTKKLWLGLTHCFCAKAFDKQQQNLNWKLKAWVSHIINSLYPLLRNAPQNINPPVELKMICCMVFVTGECGHLLLARVIRQVYSLPGHSLLFLQSKL